MNNTKKALILLTASTLILLTSCGQTPEQKKKEAEEADKKVNVIGIMKSGDPGKCNELKDPIKVKNCVNNLYYNKAITEKDTSVCDKIEKAESKVLCKAQIIYDEALSSGDKKICSKIEKETIKSDCVNNVIMNKALSEGKTDACKDFIGDITICKDEVNKTIAMSKNNPKLCDLIKDKSRNNICKMSVAQANPTSTGSSLPPTTNIPAPKK